MSYYPPKNNNFKSDSRGSSFGSRGGHFKSRGASRNGSFNSRNNSANFNDILHEYKEKPK